MIGPGNFLCGCNPDQKKGYSSEIRKDSEGFVLCPQHGVRMYGWATPTGHIGAADVLDLSKMSSYKSLEANFFMPDNRDTRDPQTVGMEILAKKNGASNAGTAAVDRISKVDERVSIDDLFDSGGSHN